MNEKLNPDALKALRKKRGWTQSELSEKSGCSVPQISRWERGLSLDVHEITRKRLPKALGTTWEELTRQPDESKVKEESRTTVKLNTRVRRETRFALEIVSQLYGVKWADIIESAPLLFFLLAERSLDDRRKRLERIKLETENFKRTCSALGPHIAEAFDIPREGDEIDVALQWEETSINERDITGPPVGELDFDNYDAFVNSLRELATESSHKQVWFEGAIHGGAPDYRFTEEFWREVCKFSEPVDSREESELSSMYGSLLVGDIDAREFFEKRKAMSDEELKDWALAKGGEAWKAKLAEEELVSVDSE